MVTPKNVGMDQNAILSPFSMHSSRALMFTTNQICHGPCAITLYFFVNKLKIFTCFIHRGLSADRHQPVKSVYCYAQLKTFEISSFSLMRRKETLNYLWFCQITDSTEFRFCFSHQNYVEWNFEANNCKGVSLILSVREEQQEAWQQCNLFLLITVLLSETKDHKIPFFPRVCNINRKGTL